MTPPPRLSRLTPRTSPDPTPPPSDPRKKPTLRRLATAKDLNRWILGWPGKVLRIRSTRPEEGTRKVPDPPAGGTP